ncbi:PREDICTED: uncharacterized protein LOC105564361 isoform X2 [Vollenhovia emeryi]|uniref:uncharacterized protein LOC105564361 isoform X2 n=1 Tax=Vollenhovia emeryi TaxID=411798 RepID=UPI0005F4C8B9|nr:PREDICTED: uncharacterized protein LOC105564361 isoform X2 [Vollenhovia emeryi]
MNFSTTETRWMKFGKFHDFAFVGKETVATASGIYVSFLDLNTRERRIERFDNKERGDGASCLAGHPTVSMFSVVERKPNPKISIFMYPTIQRISRCVLPDRINGYLSCSFVGMEYLVSLTSFPDFRLIVWLWRTGKHVAMLNTKIDNLVQEIFCSPNPPHLIAQFGADDNTLSVYQVRTCSKIVSIHRVNAPVPGHKIVSSSWTQEGNLFVSDELGNVWLVAIEANKLYSVIKSKILDRPKNKPIVVSHKNGVIVVNTNSEITFYKKSAADWNVTWKLMWSVSTFYSIQVGRQHCSKDGIMLHSKSGEIFEICTRHDNVPQIEVIYTDEIEYKALFSISQCTDHVAAVDRLDRLCIFELSTGTLTARLSLKHHGEVLQGDTHPTLPILASCSAAGNCILIDVTKTSLLKILNCFHLYGNYVDKIKFSCHGELLGIGNSQTGMIFLVGKRLKQQRVDVLGSIEIAGFIADFFIYEGKEDRFEILVLAATDPSIASIGGNKVIVYTCEISIDFCTRAVCVIDLSRPFKTLYSGCKPLSMLGVPALSKQLHQMEIQNNFQDIVLTDALFSMHQLRNIGMYVTDARVITYGYDGLIIVRDSTALGKVIAIFMPHHRSQGGVTRAITSRFGETIVSLGRNGDLVANRIRLPEAKANLAEIETASVHLAIEDFTTDPNERYDREKETWLDSVIAAKLKAERDEALPRRAGIVADLEKIKTQIRELLDINEGKTPDARLPISAFDLNHEYRQRRIEEARLERDTLYRNLEEDCAQRDQVAESLREIFWELLEVKPCALTTIGGDAIVRNHPLVASTRKMDDFKVWDKLSSDADEFLYSYEVYDGSLGKDDSRQGFTVIPDKESSTASNVGSKTYRMAKKWCTLADEEEKLCVSGVTTHKWIEDESIASTHQLLIPHDSDLEAILRKDIIIENRERKLKMHFNDLFEEMKRAKECVLKCAEERISRLRYCASQLKMMFGIDSVLEPIETPSWNVEEIPDYIVTVKDHEIFERQPRQGELNVIDEDREDENKHAKAGDFYKVALEKMMDGVLEPTWEDEVKKEIPVPDCLIAKNPSKYTDEDIAAITLYRSKVEALQREREKYKATLQADIIETKDALERDNAAFNDKLKDLELRKMQIECAILQERLARIRAIRRHRIMVDGRQEIARLADELALATRGAHGLAEECNSLEVVVSELKIRYDSLCKAEKRQEAKFRGEFAELKQSVVEHLLRHYKKRPRAGRLTTTSVTYLTEVASCVAGNEKSDVLPRECLDFLKGMDALDSKPRNLPSQINTSYWQTMCRLRRTKIETEIKLTAKKGEKL